MSARRSGRGWWTRRSGGGPSMCLRSSTAGPAGGRAAISVVGGLVVCGRCGAWMAGKPKGGQALYAVQTQAAGRLRRADNLGVTCSTSLISEEVIRMVESARVAKALGPGRRRPYGGSHHSGYRGRERRAGPGSRVGGDQLRGFNRSRPQTSGWLGDRSGRATDETGRRRSAATPAGRTTLRQVVAVADSGQAPGHHPACRRPCRGGVQVGPGAGSTRGGCLYVWPARESFFHFPIDTGGITVL